MNERALFMAALEKEDAALRQAYLDEACGGDAVLRERVEALLRSHERPGDFLDVPAVEQLATADVTRAETPPEVDEVPSLGFLTPSAKPGSLGRLEHYEVQQVVGHGGMGIVLRAFDEELHRVVAIKVMAAQLATSAIARKRFKREAIAAAAVSHDHIVTIHAVEDNDELPYLVMQYVAGASLQERLDRDGPLELQEILRIGMQTAAGLAAAHAQGLVHRDIKPANILLENGVERVKITDFGLARAAADASVTQSGIIAGTPQYMAPEQANGEAVDGRADLFSLGSVLYAMCTGRAPFRASGTVAVLKRVCEETPTPIRDTNPEIPEWLVAIIDKLHAKGPDKRFQSAAEVAELLGGHLAHVQHPSVVGQVTKILADRSDRKPAPRQSGWAAIAAAAAVLLILLGGLSLTEATGVTNLSATVIRIFTPEGTLVVETNDPAVKVTVEGDGGLVITGAGLEEIRLRPGSYRIHADKNGKPIPLDKELVTVARGGLAIVKVKLESSPPAATAKADKGAFVLLGGKGIAERKFNTLAEAVQAASDGDTIEVRGNGPFVSDAIDLSNKALTIRAGTGYAPVIRYNPGRAGDPAALLKSSAALVLEGLALLDEGTSPSDRMLVNSSSAPLYVANCKLVIARGDSDQVKAINTWDSSPLQLRNCLVVSRGYGLLVRNPPRMQVTVNNCLVAAQSAFAHYPNPENALASTVRLTRNTWTGAFGSSLMFRETLAGRLRDGTAQPVVAASIETEGNIWQVERVIVLNSASELPIEAQRGATRKLLQLRERGNLYSLAGQPFLNLDAEPSGYLRDLTEWNQFWGFTDTGSLQGSVRLRGNPNDRLADNPAAITPDDFRLRPDSAGFKAGKDGKDLGADVDLVGPGAAYEQWKKAPEYQEWLKDTGQRRETADAGPETGAFVLLGGPGVAERGFDTLAEAVRPASNGDAIEIRGNGPFVTPPVDIGNRALTLRAAPGIYPVVRLDREGSVAGAAILSTRSNLVLEGLEFGVTDKSDKPGFPARLIADGPSVSAANCRFHWPSGGVFKTSSRTGRFRNCQFVTGEGGGLAWHHPNDGSLSIDNCVQANGGLLWIPRWPVAKTASPVVRVANCTVRARTLLSSVIDYAIASADASPEKVVGMSITDSVLDVNELLMLSSRPELYAELDPLAEKLNTNLPHFLAWKDRQNLYAADNFDTFVALFGSQRIRLPSLGTLPEWDKLWGQENSGSSLGRVRYQGGDPLAGQMTPDDFRLREDSAGYRADPDGKDLGADVDLVGPGAAYERWKKTPEYQEWLKETGQLQAEAQPEAKAFVVLDEKGLEIGKNDILADAVRRAGDGYTIEIRGNGPFVTDPLDLGDHRLTIRAGAGYVPVIKPSPAAVRSAAALVKFQRALTLEGLELHHHGVPEENDRGFPFLNRGILGGHSAPIFMTNCRLIVTPGKSSHAWAICCLYPPRVRLRNCLIVCPESAYAVGVWNVPGTDWTVENCLIASPNALLLVPDPNNAPGTTIRVSRSHLIGAQHTLVVGGPADALVQRLRDKAAPPVVPAIVETEGNVIQCSRPFCLNSVTAAFPDGLPVDEQRHVLPQMIRWLERGNVFDPSDAAFLNLHAPPTGLLKGLAEWNTYWGLKDTGSVQSTVRLRGSPKDLIAENPEAITPEDFRLRADSAGYRAGKDGKDLGADVDLVGPGPAYERWKRLPEYQEWLKDTGQAK